MQYWQKAKDWIKYATRKYFWYDLSVLNITLNQDFLDQKKLFSVKSADIIFDVGANAGQTTHKYRKIFPKSSIYGFEPYPRMFTKFVDSTRGDKKVYSVKLALTNQKGNSEFFVNKFHGTNSLLSNNEEYTNRNNAYERIATIKVDTETLDNYCLNNEIKKINILKMDVQGGELLVLQGAKQMLESVNIDVIYTEVMFIEVYKDQPLFSDIESFLKQFGYTLYKKYNLYHEQDGKLSSGDVIFVSPSFKIKN